jgi:hypothetical protein
MEAGLIVELCGLTLRAAAALLGCSWSAVKRRVAAHRELLSCEPGYAAAAAGVVQAAVRREYPAPVAAVELAGQLEAANFAQA